MISEYDYFLCEVIEVFPIDKHTLYNGPHIETSSTIGELATQCIER